MNKSLKTKMAICATISSLIGTGIGIGLNESTKNDGPNITYPIIMDDIETYGVTTTKYHLNSSKKTSNEKKYLNMTEIRGEIRGEFYVLGMNAIELNIYSPWKKTTGDNENLGVSNVDEYYIRDNYYCEFSYNDITEKEILNIIKLFQENKIFDIYNMDTPYIHSQHKAEYAINIPNEEKINNEYSAELTIKTVDYNDIKITKQTKEDNYDDNMALLWGEVSLLPGLLIGLAWDEGLLFSEKKKSKTKKLTK